MSTERRALAPFLLLAAAVVLLAGCRQPRQAMYDQEKYEPYETSTLFADGASARPFPQGTVARGALAEDRPYHTGTLPDGSFVAEIPVAVDRALLARGRERFDVFCSPCHGRLGEGNGMVAQRGYKRPPSYHVARLRTMPDGYFFDVITRGFGQMPSYATQVPVDDRWAIVAYVRALQLSQNARLADLPAELQEVAERALAGGEAPADAEDPVDTMDEPQDSE